MIQKLINDFLFEAWRYSKTASHTTHEDFLMPASVSTLLHWSLLSFPSPSGLTAFMNTFFTSSFLFFSSVFLFMRNQLMLITVRRSEDQRFMMEFWEIFVISGVWGSEDCIRHLMLTDIVFIVWWQHYSNNNPTMSNVIHTKRTKKKAKLGGKKMCYELVLFGWEVHPTNWWRRYNKEISSTSHYPLGNIWWLIAWRKIVF